MVFQLTPGTEAPAEMNIYFPQFRVFNVAENVTHRCTTCTRCAAPRSATRWRGRSYIEQTRELFAGQADVMIAQHHWPKWGAGEIDDMLRKQRDLYKYIHDQTVRLMNQGYTPREIAERSACPPSLGKEWSARGYYGTVSHNTKAVYQSTSAGTTPTRPTSNPLPPAEAAQKYVEYMGGANAVHRARARRLQERQLPLGRRGR